MPRYVLQPEQQTLEIDGIECRAYFWAARGDLGGYLAGGFGVPQEPDHGGDDQEGANEVPAGWVDDDGDTTKKQKHNYELRLLS